MRFFLAFLLLSAYSLKAQNVQISSANLPNEPSIMMDPKHPQYLIAASNIDNYYLSSDTGHTWTAHNLSSSYGVWGDPMIAVDTAGDFYFFHLSNPASGNWIDRIVCQKTTDHGQSWNNGSFTGLNGTKAQDKHWVAIDRNNNNMYVTWTQFDSYGSSDPLDSSIILFSRSLDAGQTWSTPVRINKVSGDCIDSDNTVEGAVPAVGPNGEVFVAWAGPNGLVFNRSLDQGLTWLPNEIAIDPMPTGWDYAVSGIYRANGLPVTVCDVSGGPNNGTIYVNWSDQRNGASNTDIFLAKSTDGGNTWSAPVKVNNDNSNRQQFFTYMAIDQTNGNLYFVFYDRRRFTSDSTDVYLALSTDGGSTFINQRISATPFYPNDQVFFGDYTNITVHDGIVRPIWTRLHNGQLSVWTDLASYASMTTGTNEAEVSNDNNVTVYPNPASDVSYLSFKLHEKSSVRISVLNSKGQEVKEVLKTESRPFGKYLEKIDLRALGLSSGNYLLRLEINGKVHTSRQIIVD